MHKIDIPDEIKARAAKIHGRDGGFLTVDPRRTAHIVVDLQNGFMRPGAPIEVPAAREIVGDVNRISAAIRAAGGLNVFLRYTYDENEKLLWTAFYRDYSIPSQVEMMKKAFAPGAEDWQLWAGLDIRPGDLVIDKTRFSGFIPGTCELHEDLQRRGIDTLIVTGTLTNCCCESTARDAMQMNYKIIFVADGNAALTDAEHNATLCNMTAIFADVLMTDAVVATIEAGVSFQAAAA